MTTVGGVSGGTLSTAVGIEQLVKQMTLLERQPITRLETQKDDLEVKKSIYSDIQTKLETLRTAADNLTGDSGALNTFSASVSDSDYLGASVTSSSSASAGSYAITVSQLAKADIYVSDQQASTTTALNLSGTLTIESASPNSVSNENSEGNTTVSDFDVTSSIRDGETELTSDTYYVEVRDNSGTWEFRVVDSTETAVSVDDASDDGTAMTTGWQELSNVAGKTFDTGRGLIITFDTSESYEAGTKAGDTAASVTYSPQYQDVDISVSTSDSLTDIRDAINDASFASDKGVIASIVDSRLMLTSANTGSDSTVSITQTGLDLGYGAAENHVQTASDASLTINGLNVTPSSNTGLTDLVAGLSLDLKDTGSTTLTVSKNNDTIVSDVQSFLKATNGLINHLKLKTEPQLDSAATGTNPTYNPAPLGTDYTMKELRFSIASDLLSTYTDATNGSPDKLSDLGIEIGDDNVSFELSDSSKLTSALNTSFEDVSELLTYISDNLDSRLAKFLDGTSAIISNSQEAINDEIDSIDDRITNYEARLTRREEALRNQFYKMQAQLFNMQYQFQSQAAMFGNANMFNQLG